MKILFLSQGQRTSDHPGWHNALEKLKSEGFISYFLNIPYLGYAQEHGWDNFYKYVVSICSKENFDLIYFHYFHDNGTPSPIDCIKNLRKLRYNPVIITSVGDPFSDNYLRPDYPQDFKEISRLADITFSTQMGKAVHKMIKWGAKNVVLAPNSMCQVRFKSHSVEIENHKFDFDVVFVGSHNANRIFNPISQHWLAAKKREKLVKALHNEFGNKFGLFGEGWNYTCSQGPIPFDQQQNTFRRGRILVGGNPYSNSDYYSSNRVFFEISSGIPTVELSVPRLDKILRNNDHCYFASNVEDIIVKCKELLNADPVELYNKAASAATYIEDKHTQYHRMKFKIETVRRYIANGRILDVNFPFFLPEVNLNEEMIYATRITK